MMEIKLGDLRALVEGVRGIVSDWDAFVGSVEALTRDHEQLRADSEHLGRQHDELRQAHERLVRDNQECAQALVDLGAAHETLRGGHETLRGAHEATSHELHEVRERYEALRQDRQYAADELESVLRRLKPRVSGVETGP